MTSPPGGIVKMADNKCTTSATCVDKQWCLRLAECKRHTMSKATQKASDAEVIAWAERHDLRQGLSELRCIFEDAQTLVPAATPEVPHA